MADISTAEKIAVACLLDEWTQAGLKKSTGFLFGRKRQPWLDILVSEVLCQFQDPPAKNELANFIQRNRGFRAALKLYSIKGIKLDSRLKLKLGKRSLVSIQWPVPKLDSQPELASFLGLSVAGLHWLAAGKGAPDYRTKHYVFNWHKKRTHGLRLVESPKQMLKIAQRQILNDILRHCPPHRSAHGFCRRRNVISFVEHHAGKACCLRLDLKDFFPSITVARVCGLFESIGYRKEIARPLALISTTQTPRQTIEEQFLVETPMRRKLEAIYCRRHLPQGAPTSPAVANLVAFKLDTRLAGLASKLGASYSRYADDLLFSGDRNFARISSGLQKTIGAIVLEEGFELNYRKTQIQMRSQRQIATGVVLNEQPNVPREQFDILKATLFNCTRSGWRTQNRNEHPNFKQHLLGRINWIAQLAPNRARKLEALFNQIDWT